MGYQQEIIQLWEAYSSVYSNLFESHFKVGDEVICKDSGMEGEVVKVDPEEKGKYYTVKREDGKMVKYAPDELKLESEEKEEEEDEDEKDNGEKMEESVDLFDYLLEYLVAEGYADTNKAALAIMTNMSEDWRNEIIDEAQIMSVSGKGGLKHMINPKIVRAQNAAARERQGRQERENQAKNTANAERSAQDRKASIQRLNAKPGADSGDYDSGYHGDDDTSGGKRHYSLSRTDRNARRRRESGR